ASRGDSIRPAGAKPACGLGHAGGHLVPDLPKCQPLLFRRGRLSTPGAVAGVIRGARPGSSARRRSKTNPGSMNYAHEMPFGAAIVEGGRVRFRLWAPEARNVCLNLGPSSMPMVRSMDGWFELTREASPGAHYHFTIGRGQVPDPASRYQPLGIHGASEVIKPRAFEWKNGAWAGRPWEEAVLYELH